MDSLGFRNESWYRAAWTGGSPVYRCEPVEGFVGYIISYTNPWRCKTGVGLLRGSTKWAAPGDGAAPGDETTPYPHDQELERVSIEESGAWLQAVALLHHLIEKHT